MGAATPSLVVAPIRLALGLAGLAAAAIGAGFGTALRQFLFGAALVAFVVLIGGVHRPRWFGRELEPLPPDSLFLSRWQVARAAVYPSTVGLTVLTAVALVFDTRLAALIAGLLTGAGVAALAIGLYSAWWAHTRGLRVFVERGRGGRVFAERRER